ncbi:porin [Alistipes sp.]|uniref:porin n=1 Tax=Alistipes sp. TaxID=1872444 RepID=UPI000E99A170|nr:porin [Alistipes sp.]HBX90717.1 hypothetical protein [Alistipes sp.]HCN13400.1 hypothetical protein [Alistipes sp.]
MKRLLLALLLCPALPLAAAAPDDRPDPDSDGVPHARLERPDLSLEVRTSFTHEAPEGGDPFTGLRGEYLNLRLEGSIGPAVTYHFRLRINKFDNADGDLFNATDWVYLTWRPTLRTALSAGKQPVAMGGYEVDCTPVDDYFYSVFVQHLACYQFALSASRTSASGDHTLTAQWCNSPFGRMGDGLFAYNLMWSGRMGSFTTLWSANLLEYERGRHLAILSLGTAFERGLLRLEFDLMERALPRRLRRLRDITCIGRVCCTLHERVRLLFKCGYDRNGEAPSQAPAADRCVAPGTDRFFYGGGVELFPRRGSRDLRLHALCADANGTVDGLDRPMRYVSVGLLWRVKLCTRR